ncbi:hypothetical protein PG985_010346 [Apiospora marii]|uniref:uncharacterized protein n=1 Tax=Apiospora marii TaxID=335849 RepID=UPI00312D9D51
MCLCFSLDIVWPVIGLVISRSVPDDDQALAGGVLQTASLVGRAMRLALAAAVQVDVLQQDTGLLLPVTDWPLMYFGGPYLLPLLRAAQWTNIGLAGLALLLVLVFFRKLGRV